MKFYVCNVGKEYADGTASVRMLGDAAEIATAIGACPTVCGVAWRDERDGSAVVYLPDGPNLVAKLLIEGHTDLDLDDYQAPEHTARPSLVVFNGGRS